MPTPNVWTFTQLAGPKLPISLGGWSAPFGRPRKGAILDAGITIRCQRTDYPGTNLTPTIHSYGTTLKPFEVHGRWMDQTIPAVNGAQALVRKWKDFINAQVVVRAQWGAILSYQIFIHELSLKFESQAEVEWSMIAHTLVDEQAPVTSTPVSSPTPIDVATQMQAEMDDVMPFDSPLYAPLFGMLGGVSASFGLSASFSLGVSASFSASVGFGATLSAFAGVSATCAALTDFDTAQTSDLGAMAASLSTMQDGLFACRDSTDYLMSQAGALNEGAPTGFGGSLLTGDLVAQLSTDKAASDAAISNLLGLIASLQTRIAMTQRGQPQSAYVGLDGDTWEQVGDRLLGGPDGGRAIRAMNGVRYGEQPTAGRKYTIPKAA